MLFNEWAVKLLKEKQQQYQQPLKKIGKWCKYIVKIILARGKKYLLNKINYFIQNYLNATALTKISTGDVSTY